MNDRSLCLLDNYDIEVLHTRKGRGAILCETNRGILIWKEYTGYKDRAIFQDSLLSLIKEKGFQNAESVIKNKDGELVSQDVDGTCYVLKTYFEGRECNVRDMEECRQAVRLLADFHSVACMEEALPEMVMLRDAYTEFEKHNRELKRVKKYLRDRGQKTDFELYLMRCYDYFLDNALQVTEEAAELKKKSTKYYICHGDYQHHNIIFAEGGMQIINFEKCGQDSPMRDLYLFLRKLLEKNTWSVDVGFEIIKAYESHRIPEREEILQLYYRLSYPEKFWKIVNFYYNSGKAWIPGKNLEKLQRVVDQETEKQAFLSKLKNAYEL